MMNVRKKEGRSMKRNNYLPATREPEFKGSLSLLTFSICQTSRHKYRQREREGTWGWGTASLTPRNCWRLCSEAATLPQETHREGKRETLHIG